ncbi:MAG: NAD(+)/NADH kinase [Actinobacteria bacterium]|nr:NAD(+)/NADH kinase [Actinomycetota bacterium]
MDDGHSERLVEILGERGVEVEQLTEPTGDRVDGDLDLVFVLGGDGTMLRASRMFPGRVLLGVNLGKVGFMSGMRPEDLDRGCRKFSTARCTSRSTGCSRSGWRARTRYARR